jgi:OOP family OmpA-OmpF porin
VVGVGALVAWLAGSGPGWAMTAPLPLTVESGPYLLWCNSNLDTIEINAAQTQAFVRLHTQKGLIERTLPLRDGGGGVRRFALESDNGTIHTELSFNPETREFFFSEASAGSAGGEPYSVKAHGWLTQRKEGAGQGGADGAGGAAGKPDTSGKYTLDDSGCADPSRVRESKQEPKPEAKQEPQPAPEAQWKAVPSETPVRIDGSNFAVGSARLLPRAGERLSVVLDAARRFPDLRLEVEGHTDSTGSRALNQPLSEQRAEAVKAWLVEHGIEAGRIETAGFADARPVGSNQTPQGRAANRRVEVRYVIRQETKVRVAP